MITTRTAYAAQRRYYRFCDACGHGQVKGMSMAGPAQEQQDQVRWWPAPARAWQAAAGATAAALLLAMWLRFGASPVLPAFGYLAVISAPLAFIDVASRRLPDALVLPSYPAALVLLGVAAPVSPDGTRHLITALTGMAAAVAFFVLQALIYPSGIGWGDVKLSGVTGLYLGWFGVRTVLTGLIAGYLLAAVAGLVLIAAGQATRKSHIPFGPFMLAGALVMICFPALSR
jgi:leader peptidase (prepilin peptidase) / N-methyltransferase